jgi:type II secretory pathway pseudopilin PulG
MTWRCPRARRRAHAMARAGLAFTLIELLVVVSIIVLVMAMLDSVMGPRIIRGNAIANAAYELAGVLRQARQLAMDHNGFYGVTFNIQNAPGSSGAVLNNRSGDHWYRIIGPHDQSWQSGWSWSGGYSMPVPLNRSIGPNGDGSGDTEVSRWFGLVQNDMVGPRYHLPKGKVRFIALTDEDNGNYWTPYSSFAPSYPRPWFGDFLQLSGDAKPRLYAWGGYEAGNPNFLDTQASGATWRVKRPTVNFSGFYYQGDDNQPITGCQNPFDRYIVDELNAAGQVDTALISDPGARNSVAGEDYRMFAQGEVRPLVNADWLDYVILFGPDGTASTQEWMSMRHAYGVSGSTYGCHGQWEDFQKHNLMQLGPGDMCNQEICTLLNTNQSFYNNLYYQIPYNTRYEASSYTQVTGMLYVTLGADAADDTVTFPSAQAALASMMPMYRVGVSKLGEVQVFRVGQALPAGATLDSKWAGATWQSPQIGRNGYWNNIALNPATGQQCLPAEDFVTAGMMENQQWWLDP